MAWGKAAIGGVGATQQGKLPDETPLSLAAEALRGRRSTTPASTRTRSTGC